MRLVLTQPAIQFSGQRSHIREISGLLETSMSSDDMLVLPELIGGAANRNEYLAEVRWLAKKTGAWIVGGSHHWNRCDGFVNCGVVMNPGGEEIASYEKSHPYGSEVEDGVIGGTGGAVFEINGLRCVAMICADFWYASSFYAAGPDLDVVIVPSFSFSQRPTPQMARARWIHATIARAYEFATFVGVSDWAHPVSFRGSPSSGVAGFAHPNPAEVDGLYQELGGCHVRSFELDMAALHELRANRNQRGFGVANHRSKD